MRKIQHGKIKRNIRDDRIRVWKKHAIYILGAGWEGKGERGREKMR